MKLSCFRFVRRNLFWTVSFVRKELCSWNWFVKLNWTEFNERQSNLLLWNVLQWFLLSVLCAYSIWVTVVLKRTFKSLTFDSSKLAKPLCLQQVRYWRFKTFQQKTASKDPIYRFKEHDRWLLWWWLLVHSVDFKSASLIIHSSVMNMSSAH